MSLDIIQKYAGEIKTAFYSAFVFLNINTDIVKILLALMFLDTLFGIWKAVVMNRKIKAGILFEGIISKAMILLIPMVLALISKGVGYDFKLFPDIILKVLIMAEGFSIITSFYTIRTKKEPKDVDLITMILTSLRKIMMSFIGIWLKKLDEPLPNEDK